MNVKIAQDFKYQGDDWWKWWIWLEGPEDELDQIDHVVYKLHPTFPNPVRTVKDRDSKFRLESTGWGVFTIRAKVVHKNGEENTLKHDLELLYDDGTPTTA